MATDPLALEAEVKALQRSLANSAGTANKDAATPANGQICDAGLVQNLINEFGLGAEPRLRRVLYERLRRLEQQHGQIVEILITEARALARAPGVLRPGNYFARAICLKLRENGLA
jgi:hypothetical protein